MPDYVLLRQIAQPEITLLGRELLGRGETEAILLAREINADLLLMDDRKGRTAAEHAGIKYASLPAVLILAKQRGCLASIRAELDRLEELGGLYLSDRVKAEALRLAGE